MYNKDDIHNQVMFEHSINYLKFNCTKFGMCFFWGGHKEMHPTQGAHMNRCITSSPLTHRHRPMKWLHNIFLELSQLGQVSLIKTYTETPSLQHFWRQECTVPDTQTVPCSSQAAYLKWVTSHQSSRALCMQTRCYGNQAVRMTLRTLIW